MLTNPLQGVKLAKYEPKEMRVLSKNEMYRLIQIASTADTRFGYGVIFTLYTGLRLGELLGLKWTDVDDLHGSRTVLHIRRTLTRQTKPRRNDPDYEIIRWNPGNKTAITLGKLKSPKSRRDMFLPDVAVDCLRKIKEWHEQMDMEFKGIFNPHNFIFTSLKGEAMEPRTFTDYFYDLVKVSKIPHANFHSLRHSGSSLLLAAGIPMKAIQEWLGHGVHDYTQLLKHWILATISKKTAYQTRAYTCMIGCN